MLGVEKGTITLIQQELVSSHYVAALEWRHHVSELKVDTFYSGSENPLFKSLKNGWSL